MPDWPAPAADTTHLAEQLDAALNHIEVLQEGFADLELAAEDQGWVRLSAGLDQELTRKGIGDIARNCRVMAVASPMLKRGLQLRNAYVWGLGVDVAARDGDVNAVLQAFWGDESNQRALTSPQACEENERVLGTDGNFFLAFFTDPLTGRVQVRSTPFAEIQDVINNPEDRDDPWFYLRQYETTLVEAGYAGTRTRRETRRVLHPALGYRPNRRPRTIDGVEVRWDEPMLHVPVNRLDGTKWGVPDAYAALPWVRAYEGFLTDWAKLVKSLSRFAWRLSGDKSSKARRAAQTISDALPVPGRTSEPGAVAASGPGAHLEAIPKSGATIDSESGRPLAAIVAAGLGVPVTMLLADPGTTGARATAETLDRPTELEAGNRRALWGTVLRQVANYVVDQAVKAPRGPLTGTRTIDPYTGRETITLAGDAERTVDITWPDLTDETVKDKVAAIVEADGTGKLPPLVVARLLLLALGVEDVDELLAPGNGMVDDDGNWIDPDATAGDEAVRRFRRGEDPAEALR